MNRLKLSACLGVLTITGCDKSPVPPFVDTLIERDFPPDSRIHVLRAGQFHIQPDSIFCTFPESSFPLDGNQVRKALAVLKQSEHWEGTSRINAYAGDEGCKRHSAIFIYGKISDNRQGKPYKVTLSAWQGQAAWVGKIERSNGSVPGISELADEEGRPVGPSSEGLSAVSDAYRMSNSFTTLLTKNK